MSKQAPHAAITGLLHAVERGDRDALDDLFPLVYDELRRLARQQRRRWHGDITMDTTALVHEAYLKLVGPGSVQWRDRAHFCAIASVAMRQILVDRARARARLKRGGSRTSITLDEDVIAIADQAESLLEINEALNGLAQTDSRLARVVECRFFGGMSEEEVAEAFGVTVRTVQRDWAKARMLLRRALGS